MLVLDAPGEQIERLAFSPDGSTLAAGTRSGVLWWEDLTGQDLPFRFGLGPCHSIGFSSSGEHLVVSVDPSHFELKTRVRPHAITHGRGYPCPVGNLLLFVGLAGDRTMVCYKLGGNGPPRDVWRAAPLLVAVDVASPFPRDGSWFVRCSLRPENPSGVLEFRRTISGELLRERRLHDPVSPSLTVSGDGQWVSYCSGRRVISIRTQGDDPPVYLTSNTPHHFTAVAFHPSGRYLAATSNDATVKLYDTASWQVARTFTWDVGRLRSVAFSPDGTRAAVGSDTGKVVVWDVDV